MLNRRTLTRPPLCAGALLASGGIALAQDKLYIPLISKGFQHQFWQAVKAGADKAAEPNSASKVTFEGPDTEAQVDKQIDMLAAALAKKPAAIGFAALDSQAAIPLLKQAQDAGIPVIAFDSGVDSDIPVTTVTTDNLAAAGAGRRQDGRTDRWRGQSGAGRARPDLAHRHRPPRRLREPHRRKPIRRSRSSTSSTAAATSCKSTEITKAILTANPNLKGIFGANEGSAIGVLNAVKETEAPRLVVIGYDSGKQQKDAIRAARWPARSPRTRSASATRPSKAAVEGAQGREAAEDHRHRLLLVRQDQHRRDPKIAAVLYD